MTVLWDWENSFPKNKLGFCIWTVQIVSTNVTSLLAEMVKYYEVFK